MPRHHPGSYWYYLALWLEAAQDGNHEAQRYLDAVLRAIAAYHTSTLSE